MVNDPNSIQQLTEDALTKAAGARRPPRPEEGCKLKALEISGSEPRRMTRHQNISLSMCFLIRSYAVGWRSVKACCFQVSPKAKLQSR